MRDLYLPIDLSQEASVQTILAHSASHMAYLRGERSSAKAVMHKMTAIRLVNEYLNDPIKSISDEAFSTVMRLITFEASSRFHTSIFRRAYMMDIPLS